MSLKAVHLVFVTILTALAFGTAVWKARDYFSHGRASGDLWFAVGAAVVGVLVLIYGRYFLRKLKSISYL